MRFHSHPHLALGTLLTLALIPPLLPRLALATPTIALTCRVTAPSLVAFYVSRFGQGAMLDIEQQLCEHLLFHLSDHHLLSLWNYRWQHYSGPITGGPALNFAVIDGAADQTLVTLNLQRPDFPMAVAGWEETWRKPSDAAIIELPAEPKTAADELFRYIARALISAHEGDLQVHLRKVAIADATWLQPGGPPKLLSTLPSTAYPRLRASKLLVECLTSAGSEDLEATASAEAVHQDLVLIANRRISDGANVHDILPQMRALSPAGVYLNRYEDPKLPEVLH